MFTNGANRMYCLLHTPYTIEDIGGVYTYHVGDFFTPSFYCGFRYPIPIQVNPANSGVDPIKIRRAASLTDFYLL